MQAAGDQQNNCYIPRSKSHSCYSLLYVALQKWQLVVIMRFPVNLSF